MIDFKQSPHSTATICSW